MLNQMRASLAEAQKQREQEQMNLNRQIAEIKLQADGKNTCLFNPNDPIFFLEDQTVMPSEDEKAKMVMMA